MRQFGILFLGSILAAACASNPPPEASSATVAQATSTPNNGPDFSPASADGLATAPAEKRAPASPTQPAPNLNPPQENALNAAPRNNDTSNNTWGNGADGSAGVTPTTGNAAASPTVRSGNQLTPMDQGPSQSDRALTLQIRQAVMHDSSLSFSAKNVKIITIQGKVTLTGAVKTEAERTSIENTARNIAGSAQVDSQIEVSK